MRKDDKRIAPTEHEVAELVASIRASADRTRIEYAWIIRASYAPSVGEQAKIRSTSRVDPTGSLVSARSKQKALSACSDAVEQLRNALAEVRHAESTLLRALDQSDPRERFEPLRYPRIATREDLRLAEEAQERRIERQEGIP